VESLLTIKFNFLKDSIVAYISFTKKAAAKLKIDNANAVAHNLELSEADDWVVDTVWNVKRDPWIMFYHRPSTFAVLVQPDKYKLENCIDLFLMLIQELLIKYNLLEKMPYFLELFKNINICHNNDRSSTAYMTQNKITAYWALENPNLEYRVADLYGLMIRVNDMLRKKFDMEKSSLEAFIEMITHIAANQHTLH
jgi:hypothetical protein